MVAAVNIEVGADVLTVFNSDALSALRQMPGESVQTCVTSPDEAARMLSVVKARIAKRATAARTARAAI